jgi:hypothetical protein
MDTLTRYRQLIKKELEQYASFSSNHSVKDEIVFDEEHDRYLLISIGWEGEKRVLYPVIHVAIINGKIWIQEDNTDWPIAEALVQVGIPKSDIVLGFHPEYVRQHTGYAIS